MQEIGVDLVFIKRMAPIIEDKRLLKKIFTEEEIAYAELKANKSETYAGLFASKEATLKSLKRGLEACPLTDIEIVHRDGIPSIKLHNKIKEENEAQKCTFSLSIAHDGDYAIATVLASKL